MDFRLKVFKIVAELLSFTKASKLLGISQPAVTRHIQELENIYKIQLFERVGGKISLTSEGKLFLEHSNRIVAAYDSLMEDVGVLKGTYGGELKIGATPAVAQYMLPSLAAGFMKRFPKVRISLVTAGNSNEVEKALDNHIIDLGAVEAGNIYPNIRKGNSAEYRLPSAASNQLDVVATGEMSFTCQFAFVSLHGANNELSNRFITFVFDNQK